MIPAVLNFQASADSEVEEVEVTFLNCYDDKSAWVILPSGLIQTVPFEAFRVKMKEKSNVVIPR